MNLKSNDLPGRMREGGRCSFPIKRAKFLPAFNDSPRHWQARAIDLLHDETRVVGVGVSEPRLTVRSGEQVAAAAEARIPGETP